MCGIFERVRVTLFVSLSSKANDLIQLTAMTWMREFIQLAGRLVLPYSSGILTAVLPCLSYDDRKKSILYCGAEHYGKNIAIIFFIFSPLLFMSVFKTILQVPDNKTNSCVEFSPIS